MESDVVIAQNYLNKDEIKQVKMFSTICDYYIYEFLK